MKTIKWYVLIFSILGTVLLFVTYHSVKLGLCQQSDLACRSSFDLVEQVSYFFPFILFFSSLTLWLPEKYFASWWRFSRVAIPVVFALLILINLNWHHTGSGAFNIMPSIDAAIQVFIYALYVLVSTIILVRTYFSNQAK